MVTKPPKPVSSVSALLIRVDVGVSYKPVKLGVLVRGGVVDGFGGGGFASAA